jgi:CheY-like chemotaxis protein
VIVDDSRSALAKLESVLRPLGFVEVVGTATDGAMAVTVVGQKRPDLVLMDIVMPRLDGIAALRLLRSQQPALRVAIVSSAGGDREPSGRGLPARRGAGDRETRAAARGPRRRSGCDERLGGAGGTGLSAGLGGGRSPPAIRD